MSAVPKIDRLAGIECYCTSLKGTGGSIKQTSEGFRVSELIDESVGGKISTSYDDEHRYPLYLLEKQGIDSNHALMEIERELQMRLRILGIKDAKAITRQYAGMDRVTRNPPVRLTTTHTLLTLAGFTDRPISKDLLAGNKFEIAIYDAKSDDLSDFVSQIQKIGNFYGLQRFGSERLVTHLIGREIIKRDFKRAVELLLSYTTEYDTPTSRDLRIKSSDPKNYSHLLKTLPRGLDIERQVMSALVTGRDHISALRAVPLAIRRLYVHAYQSYLFNKCLSSAILGGEDLRVPSSGDLCFEMEGPATFGRIVKFENSNSNRTPVPALRMAGYSFQGGKGRFEFITRRILEEEHVNPKDFYIKEMQELSNQGGFRQAPLWCLDFAYSVDSQIHLSFSLPKGSYATTLLREILKPADPIKAGF